MRADYGAFPVWGWFTRPTGEVHGCIGPAALGLTSELAGALQSWADWQDAHQQPAGDRSATASEWQEWQERGGQLAARLAEETGATVVYQPGGDPNGPGRSWGRRPGAGLRP